MFGYSEESVAKLPNSKEFNCLVKNIYYEARGEPLAGQIAVAKVTINRTKDERYPSTICGVVYQKKQFSWTNSPVKAKMDAEGFFKSMQAATIALNDKKPFNATHYHNLTVKPNWGLRRITRIGSHIFYA